MRQTNTHSPTVALSVAAETLDQEPRLLSGPEIETAVEQIADDATLQQLDADWSNKGISSSKPFPDESNREGIEQMLLHAFGWAVESGFLKPDGTKAEQSDNSDN